jgi:PadR family transcriptional regulator AphA
MPDASLPPSAYVVLGLLAAYGPATPYDLKRWVDSSVGYFWSFPRAQLYVEPARLAQRGLVDEDIEPTGRRRHVYRITEAGKQVLREWIRAQDVAPTELRDTGLLKLFFAGVATPEDVAELARAQLADHERRLAEYERILARIADAPEQAFARATLRLGLSHERGSVEFWRQVAADPPRHS